MSTNTLHYYDEHATEFAAGTFAVDFSATQQRFQKYLKPGARLLDFGCGSGRDTKYFLAQGFQVDALDGSAELCHIAAKNTGVHVQQLCFEDFQAEAVYDGIWACASLLHLSMPVLESVLQNICQALKAHGFFYASFKYGSFSGERNGRYFTDLDEQGLQRLLENLPAFSLKEQWVSEDARTTTHAGEKWLNVILEKIQG